MKNGNETRCNANTEDSLPEQAGADPQLQMVVHPQAHAPIRPSDISTLVQRTDSRLQVVVHPHAQVTPPTNSEISSLVQRDVSQLQMITQPQAQNLMLSSANCDVTSLVSRDDSQLQMAVRPQAQMLSPIMTGPIPERYTHFFNIPMTDKHLNRMSKYINTSWKLTSVATELGMTKSDVDPYIENYKNFMEAAFHFLVRWKQQVINTDSAWKQILNALRDAGVFQSWQHLMGFCDMLFNVNV